MHFFHPCELELFYLAIDRFHHGLVDCYEISISQMGNDCSLLHLFVDCFSCCSSCLFYVSYFCLALYLFCVLCPMSLICPYFITTPSGLSIFDYHSALVCPYLITSPTLFLPTAINNFCIFLKKYNLLSVNVFLSPIKPNYCSLEVK